MSLVPPRIAALTEPPPPRAWPLYRSRPPLARPRALTSARTRPPLRPPFPGLSRELHAAQWPAREAFPEVSRDFGAPGPRGVSGGTARFPLPPRLPPGSAREKSGGEFSRDHGPPPPPPTHSPRRAVLLFAALARAPRARARPETPLEGRGLSHVGGRRRHLVAPPSAGSGAARNGGAAGRRGGLASPCLPLAQPKPEVM